MRFHFKRLSRFSGLLAVALVLSATRGGEILAQGVAATQAPPPPVDAAERVRGILERFCADCLEAGLGVALELDDLARDPSFVIPKQPDASRVYQRLLDAQMSPAAASGPVPEAKPTAADVEIIRDWIDGLPAADELCAGRVPVSAEETEKLAALWLKPLSLEEAADTRFISLTHLYSACLSEKRLKQSREAVGVLLMGLARRAEPQRFEALGDASALLAIRLSEIGLTAERWARLIDGAPRFVATAVPGDWLAARVLSHPRGPDGAIDAAFDAPMNERDLLRVRALARVWNGDVDLRRAAVEMRLDRAVLAQKLYPFSGDLEGTARRLLQGAISRAEWDDLKAALEGAEPLRRKPLLEPSHIDVVLWTDKPAYQAGELVEISVSVDRACYLTLINVDRDGKAIVLFPNDLEPDNLIAPRVALKVPGANAGYRLRFDRAGRETLVAHCQRSGPRMAGLTLDYERQRFTILGDWRTFLRTAAEREAAFQRAQQPRSRQGKRGRDDDPPAAPSKLDNPTAQGRAAVSVTIE